MHAGQFFRNLEIMKATEDLHVPKTYEEYRKVSA